MEQKKALVKQFIPILLGITSQLELDSYLRKLSNVTGFEMESIRGHRLRTDQVKKLSDSPAKL